jgi:ABC-2 type transport system permease protein
MTTMSYPTAVGKLSYLNAVGNEIYKAMRVAWSERVQLIIEVPMFIVFTLLLGPMLGQGHRIISTGTLNWSLSSRTSSILFVWFAPYLLLQLQVTKMFWRLLGEIQSGTLEQVYLSPLPSWLVTVAGRGIAVLTESIIVAGLLFAGVRALVPLHFHLTPSVLLPLALIILVSIGVSLIIAGLTLVWRRIPMIVEGILILIFLGSVSAIPVVTMPGWWDALGRLFPVNVVLTNLYGVLFQGRSVTTPWGPGGLVWMLIVTAVYLAAGILAFRAGEKIAKRRGSLSRY